MDDERKRRAYERSHDPARLLALSDGVFAIVITLLVLEIHVPDLTNGTTLRDALRQTRPSFVAFLISFVVTAIAWAGHRDLFSLIKRTDRALVWLNIVYLLPLSILPFGASLIAEYDTEPVALRMYGGLLVAIALTRLAIWWYATGRSTLLHDPIDSPSRRAGMIVVTVPAVVYAFAIAIAWSAPTASLVIYAAVPIIYFIGITITRTSAKPGSADEDFT